VPLNLSQNLVSIEPLRFSSDICSDLDVALRALGYNPATEEVEELTEMMNVDGDKTIDFGEFCMIIEHLKETKGECGELR